MSVMNAKYFQLSIYLKNGRSIFRKATFKDVNLLTGSWDLDPSTKVFSFRFEHPESAPITFNLDSLDYIDYTPKYS